VIVYETIVIAILSTNTKGNNSKLGTSGLGNLFKKHKNILIISKFLNGYYNFLKILR